MSSRSNCGKAADGFCYVDGTPFHYDDGFSSWWTGTEPDNAPGSCAIVGGLLAKERMDIPCAKGMNVDILCEIDVLTHDHYKLDDNADMKGTYALTIIIEIFKNCSTFS